MGYHENNQKILAFRALESYDSESFRLRICQLAEKLKAELKTLSENTPAPLKNGLIHVDRVTSWYLIKEKIVGHRYIYDKKLKLVIDESGVSIQVFSEEYALYRSLDLKDVLAKWNYPYHQDGVFLDPSVEF